MHMSDFYEQFKEGNRAFQESYEQRLLSARNISADEETGAWSASGIVMAQMSGDFRITDLQIRPAAWESEDLTEDLLAREVMSAYNSARQAVYRRYSDVVRRHFGIS